MGIWQSKQSAPAVQPEDSVYIEIPQEKEQLLSPPPTRWRFAPVFWATPVFLYNRSLPSDGHRYTPVHPVEPFRAQQYVLQK